MRSTKFQYYFADGMKFFFSDNDCKIIFGINEGNNTNIDLYEEIGIAFTHRTARTLARHLNAMLDHFESKTGEKVKFDEVKLKEFEANLEKNYMDAMNAIESPQPSAQSQPDAPAS